MPNLPAKYNYGQYKPRQWGSASAVRKNAVDRLIEFGLDPSLVKSFIIPWQGGGAFLFDLVGPTMDTVVNSQYVSWQGDDLVFNGSGTSYGAYFYPLVFPSGVETRTLFIKGAFNNIAASSMYMCGCYTSGTGKRSYAAYSTSGTKQLLIGYGDTYHFTGIAPEAGKDVSMSYSYDGTDVTFGVDGVPLITKSASFTYASARSFFWGAINQDPYNYFNGVLKVGFLSKETLSADKINEFHERPYFALIKPDYRKIFDYGASPALSTTQIDAYISSSLTRTSLFDALISSSMVSSIGFDSLVSLAKSGDISCDSLIQATKAINVSIDAMLSAAKAGAVDIDALVFALLSKSVGIDAIISSGLSAMLGMDAMVQSEFFKSVGLDAILQGGTFSFSSIDALIQAVKSSSIGFDALIRTEAVRELILDALIKATKSGHVSLDAIIAIAGAAEAGLDALVMAVQSKTISIDAMISESADVPAQMDALIALLSIQSVGLDALVLSAKYGYLSLDALIMLSGTDQVSMDAIIALVSSGHISMDAFVTIIETTTVAVDAIVLAGKYLGLSIDAIVGALSIRPREVIQSPGMAKTIAGDFRAKILSGQPRIKIIN